MSKELALLEPIQWKEVMPLVSGLPNRHSRHSVKTHYGETRPQAKVDLPVAVNQVLNDAADYFEQGGSWCQNAMRNNQDQVCAVGAILTAELGEDSVYLEGQHFRHPVTAAALAKLADYLYGNDLLSIPSFGDDSSHDPNFVMVSDWNDTRGRTKAEVVYALREAAREL